MPFDRPRNFYMWNSMGMASSIGLGLALARPELRVIVLDGDGSLLMNLGSLATEIAAAAFARRQRSLIWSSFAAPSSKRWLTPSPG